LSPQANSTACGREGGTREEAARGIEVEPHFARESLHEDLGTFVVERAPAHVERLDAPRRGGADRGVVAIAYRVVILDDAAQRRQRQQVRHDGRTVLAPDLEHQASAGHAEMQRVGAGVVAVGRKRVLLEQIVDRDGTLVLDIGIGTADRVLVEGDRNETVGSSLGGARRPGHRRGRLIAG